MNKVINFSKKFPLLGEISVKTTDAEEGLYEVSFTEEEAEPIKVAGLTGEEATKFLFKALDGDYIDWKLQVFSSIVTAAESGELKWVEPRNGVGPMGITNKSGKGLGGLRNTVNVLANCKHVVLASDTTMAVVEYLNK